MVKVSLIAKVVAINLIFTVFAGIVVLSSVQSRLTRFQTQLATHDHTHDETEHRWVELAIQRAVNNHVAADHRSTAATSSPTQKKTTSSTSAPPATVAISEAPPILTYPPPPERPEFAQHQLRRDYPNERVDNTAVMKPGTRWEKAVKALDRFGIGHPADYVRAHSDHLKQRSKGAVFRNWWNRMDNPFFLRVLDNTTWTPTRENGTDTYEVLQPDMQHQVEYPMKDDKRYYKNYWYPRVIQCSGDPAACNARGLCDPDRGICVCHPPFTGWACEYNMDFPTSPFEPMVPGKDGNMPEFESRHCKDQEITDEKAEKWDKRTEERCAKLNGTNGMWLGLTQQQSKLIALSIASALGVKDGATVLDIGMGCGDLIGYIKAEYPGIRMAGLDYSRSAIKFVRKKFAAEKNSAFCVADVRKLEDFPSNSIDYAYENGVFSVSRDKHCKTYKDVVRMLRPGGTLLVHQTWQEHHRVKCWQNIRMQSLERCLGPTGVRFEYILTRDLTDSAYDTYCAGETYAAIIRKPFGPPPS